jgi:hypothetical protein
MIETRNLFSNQRYKETFSIVIDKVHINVGLHMHILVLLYFNIDSANFLLLSVTLFDVLNLHCFRTNTFLIF